MSPATELIVAVIITIGMFWAAGSALFLMMRPWRYFEREDLWLVWALIIAWPIIFGWMAIELAFEFHLDRKDARGSRAA